MLHCVTKYVTYRKTPFFSTRYDRRFFLSKKSTVIPGSEKIFHHVFLVNIMKIYGLNNKNEKNFQMCQLGPSIFYFKKRQSYLEL